jgi:type I restriction enzyme, S subunit
MSAHVKTTGLSNLCSLVTDGTHDSPKLQPSGVPFIKGKHISSGRLDFETCDFITEEDHLKCIKRVKPQVDDVLFANIGSVGDVARVVDERDFSIKNVALFRPDPAKVDPTYFYYLVVSPAFRGVFLNVRSGAAQPFISLEAFRTHRFPYNPDKIQQRQIGVILSAYDDLMENNRRRMVLLEEAARQLYREWFVRLRFPGHEHTPVTNGVPKGWERKTLSEMCESIDYGYTASAEQDEIGPKFLRITDIVPHFIDWASVPYCQIEDERMAKFRLCEGDIVVARTGATVGYAKRLHRRHPDTVFASYLVRLRLKPDLDNLMAGVFIESEDYKSYVQSRVAGAAQPNANAKVLAAAEILVPTPLLQRGFREFVDPLIDQREILQLQNQKLRAARDLLLPRLMSGEIAV